MDPRWRRSLWLEQLTIDPRPPLDGDVECDVVVVGAGLTGLWTAYHLTRLDPTLDVVVVEREVAGFGPSGRNGGWVSSGMAGSARAYGLRPEDEAVRRAEQATRDAVEAIGVVVASEGIDCGFTRAGMLALATTVPQRDRLAAQVESARRSGATEDHLALLEPAAAAEHVDVPGVLAATFTPHAARVQPARLTRGLAEVCERASVRIFEGTEALRIAPGRVECRAGTVRARTVLRATESYTIQLPGQGRRYLPLYSLMVATEPLPDRVWDDLGWRDGLLVRDARHLFFYAQRTTDGRIAIGGRGAPYRFGSPIAQASEQVGRVRERLTRAIRTHFPAAADATVTHHWGGPLAVPRDWSMGIGYDDGTGLGWAGGYSGHGVVASFVSGRTLAHLVTGRSTSWTTLPWVGHRPRDWEPEPLRFAASQAITRLLGRADRHEDATGRPSRVVPLLRPFLPPA